MVFEVKTLKLKIDIHIDLIIYSRRGNELEEQQTLKNEYAQPIRMETGIENHLIPRLNPYVKFPPATPFLITHA